MPLTTDVRAALLLLERLRGCDDPGLSGVQCTNDLNTLISVLHNPLLNKIVTIQDSLKELKARLSEHPSLLPDDFSISNHGKLVISTADDKEGTERTPFAPRPPSAIPPMSNATTESIISRTAERAPQLQNHTREPSLPNSETHLVNSFDKGGPESVDLLKSTSWDIKGMQQEAEEERFKADYLEEDENENIPLSIMNTSNSTSASFEGSYLRKVLALAVQGREIHHIKLYKPEGASLGFSVVGLKSEQRGDLGIYVQDIQPSGIAGMDGRLQDGDQILAIDGQVLESYISHDEAISILQKSYKTVDLVVARAPTSEKRVAQLLHQESIQKQQQLLQKQQSFEEVIREKDTPTPPLHSSTPIIVPTAHESQPPQSYNMLNTDWAQVEVIHLVNDGSGLGFGIIGGRSTGVVVKTILPTGVADRDGRLQSGDHILQIGEVNLRGMGSDQVASVLRQAGSHVRLVVARPVESASPDYQVGRSAPIVETRLLNDAEELERHLNLVTNGFSSTMGEGGGPPTSSTSSTSTVPVGGATTNGHPLDIGYINGDTEILTVTNQLASTSATAAVLASEDVPLQYHSGPSSESSTSALLLQRCPSQDSGGGTGTGSTRVGTPSPSERHLRKDSSLDLPVAEGGEGLSIADLPEMENIYLSLFKDRQGLGITIAGYVCEREELSGIFVKSINAGSSADRSGQIQVNDQIVEVDGRSISGLSNHAAVEVLRATGQEVRLKLARYLRGPKFEQLQQAIANSELKTTPTTPNPPRAPLGELPSSEALRNALDNLENANEMLQGDLAEAYNSSVQISTSAVPTSELTHIHSAVAEDPDFSGLAHHHPSPYAPYDNQMPSGDVQLQDIQIMIDSDFSGELLPSVEVAIERKWSRIVGVEFDIVVAQLCKFERGGGLGISLEGTVDVEDGKEVRPHHYIRSILPDGPVGRDARLCSGDELLEVNNHKLLGLNHVEVVTILKELPQAVRLVCGRRRALGSAAPLLPADVPPTSDREAFASRQNILSDSLQNLLPSSERLVKAKSDGSLASSTAAASSENSFIRMKSRSLEPLTGLAMWSSEPQEIELLKGDRGLGFSILDYQDPLNPLDTVIVIRSLVPGGVAEKDGRLIPGDRLVAVNGTSLENASLDQAVAVLKGAPKGPVRISVAKPVSVLESPGQVSEGGDEDNNSYEGHFNWENTDHRFGDTTSPSPGTERGYHMEFSAHARRDPSYRPPGGPESPCLLSVSPGGTSLLKSESF